MTNKEWLLSLTDRQLGYFLFCGLSCNVDCITSTKSTVDNLRCVKCGVDWLNAEHSETDIPDDWEKVTE